MVKEHKLHCFIKRHLLMFDVILLLLLFTAALLIRLKFVLGINHPPLVTDAYNYDAMTRQYLEKGFMGYMSDKPNAYITPGYPLFLALIYRVLGFMPFSPLLQVRIIQAVIGAFTCLIVYLIGKEVKNRKAGFVAGFFYALYQPFAWSVTLILTEPLYNLLFLLYIYLQLRVLKNKSMLQAFFCGIVFASAVLVRPLIFPLLVVPFAYKYSFESRYDKQVIRMFSCTLAGTVLIMTPWWIRNVLVLNKFILLATQTGNPFIAGCFPYFEHVDTSRYNARNQLLEGIRIIVEGLRSKPLLYIKWFTIGKFNSLFSYPWNYAPAEFTFLKSFWLLHYVYIVLGWFGVLFSFVRNKARLIGLYVLMLTGLQLLFVPDARYAYSIIPLLIVLSSYLIDYILFPHAKE